MTPAELEALEAACSAATPGPWESIAHLDSRVSPSVFSEACIWTEKEVLLGSVTSSYADGDFIAAARTAMPRLLAALRAAEAREAKLETVLSLAQAHGETPIPMVLHCPICSLLHVDENGWELRQHRTHQCQGCGYEWRPCSRPTVGVAAIASPGQGEEKT